MSSQLDLDDVASGNPLAEEELAEFRKEINKLKARCEKSERKNIFFIERIKLMESQIEQLKEKKFWQNEHGNEYWIYQNDESDNIKTLMCPIIISRDDLQDLINMPKG